MLTGIKNIGRALIPKQLFRFAQPYYHGLNALLANWYYGRPSRSMTVIGVTGTAGKSTTVNLLAHIMNHTGHPTGLITTANYSDGIHTHLNAHGLSMPGGWLLQKQLRDMVKNHCEYAVVECTSEGLAQNRHFGIQFDAALFTNLSPAHIDNHGSFENYKHAKGKLFAAVKKIIGVNLDDPHYEYFLRFPAERKFGTTLQGARSDLVTKNFSAYELALEPYLSFKINAVPFHTRLIGEFNAANALLAIGCAHTLGISLEDCSKALATLDQVPGRMETITNNRGVQIFVDYAPEPAAMQSALQTLASLPHRKLIHVFGSTGGHRDVQKRFEFGRLSARYADTIIITNDDVYNSDPVVIADNIRTGIDSVSGQERKVTRIKTVLDRRAAISQAFILAEPGDTVIITGKGSEQFLVLPENQRIPWDERHVVREELDKLAAQ